MNQLVDKPFDSVLGLHEECLVRSCNEVIASVLFALPFG